MTGSKFEWHKMFAENKCYADYHLRDTYTANVGFSILTFELANELGRQLYGKLVLDLGCGTGYITEALTRRKVYASGLDSRQSTYVQYDKLKAFDFCTEYALNKDIKEIDLEDVNCVILSWPDYDNNMAFEVASKMKQGQLLYYCGESYGGCTANDLFFEYLGLHFKVREDLTEALQPHHLRFRGIHDYWTVYEYVGEFL
jgi:SAM-dependent methyltransferase